MYVFPCGGRAVRAIDDLRGDYSNPVTGSVRVYREHDEIRFQPLDAPIFNGRLRPLGGNVHTINFDEMALAPQPLDPLFRVKAARYSGGAVMRTSYFGDLRSEEHTSELQSLMRISYAVFCLKTKNTH